MSTKRKPIPKAIEHQVRDQCGQACANPVCRRWNTATHELHHIDGDRSHSVLENLILLCANCHSEEQQGIIGIAKIKTWKQMAESGYLSSPSAQSSSPCRDITNNHGIVADQVHVENLTIFQKGEPMLRMAGDITAQSDRRRVAKARIRDWIDEVASAHPMYLFKNHKRISAELRTMKNLLVEDLLPENLERFTRACVAFIETTQEESYPVVTPSPMTGTRTPEDKEREMVNWRKPGNLLTTRLTEILNCI